MKTLKMQTQIRLLREGSDLGFTVCSIGRSVLFRVNIKGRKYIVVSYDTIIVIDGRFHLGLLMTKTCLQGF